MRDQSDAERGLEELASGQLRAPDPVARLALERAWPALVQLLAKLLIHVPRAFREDCGQNALLRLWRHRESYRGRTVAQLVGWIHRVVQREAHRLGAATVEAVARSATLAPEEPRTLEVEQRPVQGPPGSMEHADELDVLSECLEMLEPLEQDVLKLAYWPPEFTEREIALVMGLSKAYVHDLKRKGLDALSRHLVRRGYDERRASQ